MTAVSVLCAVGITLCSVVHIICLAIGKKDSPDSQVRDGLIFTIILLTVMYWRMHP